MRLRKEESDEQSAPNPGSEEPEPRRHTLDASGAPKSQAASVGFRHCEARQKMAILLPGVDTATVEVAVEEADGDVTALAEALGLLDHGDVK